MDLGGEAAVELEAVGGVGDVELGLGQRLPAALDLERGELGSLGLDGPGELDEELAAIERARLAPGAVVERLPRGRDGARRVLSSGLGDGGDELAVRGIVELAGGARCGVHVLAAD